MKKRNLNLTKEQRAERARLFWAFFIIITFIYILFVIFPK
jgi:hypothetical protein